MTDPAPVHRDATRLAEVGPGFGLPIGSYLSHFSGAVYLDALDHHVKRVLRVPAAALHGRSPVVR